MVPAPRHGLLGTRRRRIVAAMDADAVLGGLDASQRRAATSTATPLSVVAPAGSGKTRVLTARIAHRIAIGDIEPAHVLCVTFTRRAADELRGRLRAIGLTDRIEAGTFHAIAWRQLRDRWAAIGRREPQLLDRIRPFLHEAVVPGSSPREVADLATEIGWARARCIRPGDYPGAARVAGRSMRKPAEWVAERFQTYEQAKSERNLVDFDDLLAACTSAMDGDAAFAAAQRWRFRHLFVDEFQDVNPLQFRLLNAWRGDRWDVFVVGDTHQSIYGWNGAEPGLLEDLASEWPALETIHLDHTHRSTPQITRAAASVIRAAGLPDRHPTSSNAPGPPARIHHHRDEVDELTAVATAIRRRRGPGMGWSSFAVLARTHDQLVDAERGLTAVGIPVRIRRQSSTLGDGTVRDVLWRLQRDDRPILTALGDAIDDADADHAPLQSLSERAEAQVEADPTLTGRAFAAWAASQMADDDRVDAVTVSTIHAAKGLEWPVVHIVACEDGSIPHASARRREARREEARLLYVAITRAELEIHLHWADTRTIRGVLRERARSPFLVGFEEAIEEAAPDPASGRHQLDGARSVVDDLREMMSAPDPLDGALRDWRDRRARAARTSPDVVLPDDSLTRILEIRPATAEELAAGCGLGPSRAGRYAPELLALIRSVGSP